MATPAQYLKRTGFAEGSSIIGDVSVVGGNTTECAGVSSVEGWRAGASSEGRGGVSIVIVQKGAGTFSMPFMAGLGSIFS